MTNQKNGLIKALMLSTAMAVMGAGFMPTAQAFDLSDLDPTRIIRELTKVSVNVHNYYSFPITVVMDSGREQHKIAAGGVATFRKAKFGDNPTFHAKRDGANIKSKTVFLDGNKTVNFG